MDGLILVDKPEGLTSFAVVRKIRKIANVKRVGHAGTLDPDATGLLLVCVGKATKLSDVLMEGQKTYQTQMHFGKISDTYDSSGVITECSSDPVEEISLNKVMNSFVGKILQKPPVYSAKKINGKKLYEYARKGQEVEIPEKEVIIDSITVEEFEPRQAQLRVVCSKGTYIRSLVHDMGQALGCGALASGIRRTQSGTFSVKHALALDESITIEQLLSALIPLSKLREQLFSDRPIPPHILRRVF
ncbi:MAG: tRNA pseudouridine(55) synthase TruB [Bdellovibrionota bacterium]